MLATAVLVVSLGRAYHPVVVVGHSMEPTLRSSQLVWMDEFYYRLHQPKPGEVVVFRHGEMTYIKRVYRGPGGQVYFYGRRQDELSLVRAPNGDAAMANDSPEAPVNALRCLQVPADRVFVVGDNACVSDDSRSFGPIPLRELVGKVHAATNTDRLQFCEVPLPSPPNPVRRFQRVAVKESLFKAQRSED